MIEKTINDLLSLEIKVIPVVILYFICLFPTEFRKQIKFKYTPVYCSLPMLQHSRRLRDFHLSDFENTREERARIRRDNRASFVIESMVTPITFGLIFGIFKVPKDVIQPLMILLIANRGIKFIKCTHKIKLEQSLPNNKEIFKLLLLYISFLYLYIENMNKGYSLGLSETSLMMYKIKEVGISLVKSYIFSWIGTPIDVTSINLNYVSSNLELDEESFDNTELAVDEE